MKRKAAVIFLALVLTAFSLTGCGDTSVSSTAGTQSSLSQSQTESIANTVSDGGSEYFADGDFRDVETEDANATITLSGDEGTLSDTTRGSSGSEVTITSKGIYIISGTSENVTITVNDSKKSGNIYLILDGVSMTNSEKPCIYVEQSEKVIIVCRDSDNTLKYTASSNSDGLNGAVYSEDDLTVLGSGSLTIESSLHGIVCKDDFKQTGSDLSITASSAGIKAGDSARIGGGTLDITSEHDGIQVQNKKGDSFFYMNDGTVTINAGYDGVDIGTSEEVTFTGKTMLYRGTLNITSGGGSDNSKDSETSQKGIKCDGDILINGTQLNVSGADDSINSKGSVVITDGTLELSTSDDGITAKGTVTIDGGDISVAKSYEAIEAADLIINGGTLNTYSSDDGLNANGDETSESSGAVTINGGSIYVNSSGDGIDSNGSIYVTGGTLIVEGPTNEGNGALDKGDGSDCVASITGGTVLAVGSAGMAVNFDSGSQCSVLAALAGSEGTVITVDDGSDFSFTTTKSFDCVVYSSPDLKQGSKYNITAGSGKAEVDLSSSMYYSNVAKN